MSDRAEIAVYILGYLSASPNPMVIGELGRALESAAKTWPLPPDLAEYVRTHQTSTREDTV